ncbi:MAG: hypothetical protein KGQ93_08990 [Cyanobacteria bacterium REEB459]|nr:hypothetical protein [Cyanobacteria bacterium REEB459]
MTKKRLSDLLKEEAGKSDAADLPSPEPPPEGRRPLSRRRGTAAALHSSSSELAPEPSVPSEPPAPSALDPRLAELQQALAGVEAEKAALASTVKALQSDLEAHQGRLFELKDQLDKSQTELQAAKQTILKLSQAQSAPTPVSKSSGRVSGVDILPRSPGQSRPGYSRGVPVQPAQVSQPNPMMSNEDIGWVD